MPVYVYACATCGHGFETRQGFQEAALTVCPACGGTVRRVVQPVGIVFKGSGFYKNDSRKSTEAAVPAGERKTETPGPSGDAAPAPAGTPTPASDGSSPAPAKPTPAPPAPAAGGSSAKTPSKPSSD